MDKSYLSRVTEKLEEGEKILWTGKAKEGRILTPLYAPVYLMYFLISYGITGFLAVKLVLTDLNQGVPVNFVAPIIILAFGSVIPLARISDAVRAHKLQYAATDRRLLSLGRDSVNSVPYKSIHGALLKQDRDGYTSLLCGPSGIKLKENQWRSVATLNCTSVSGEEDCDAFVLYAIDDPEGLKKAVKDHLLL